MTRPTAPGTDKAGGAGGASHPPVAIRPILADGSAHADGLLLGLDDGDDAFLVSGVGLAGVLRRDLVDDFPGGVAFEPFGDPAADDDRLEWVVGGGQG